MKDISALLRFAQEELKFFSSSPRLDAEILLSKVLQKPRTFLIAHPEARVNDEEKSAFLELLLRRKNGESIDTIKGEKEFFGLSFLVNKDVLSPRPETEWIVEEALLLLTNESNHFSHVIDIGTGSGCILVSTAYEIKEKHEHIFERTKFLGVDISTNALLVAQKNAQKHHLHKDVSFVSSDLLKDIPLQNPSETLLLANLPYIPQQDVLHNDVLVSDPHLALFSGKDGTDLYKRLFEEIPKNIGGLLFEFHPPQRAEYEEILRKKFPHHNLSFHRDLFGEERFGKVVPFLI